MSAVDEGLTLPERQALEFQAIAKAYLTTPREQVVAVVMDQIYWAIERLSNDPQMARMFQELES